MLLNCDAKILYNERLFIIIVCIDLLWQDALNVSYISENQFFKAGFFITATGILLRLLNKFLSIKLFVLRLQTQITRMKTIGLIGGLSWLSTAEYYETLNELVNEKLGGVHSAKIILHSVDFAPIKTLTENNDWNGIAGIIGSAAKGLQLAGADCILLGANTMHKIADEIQASVEIPLIHIADAVATAINKKGLQKVALLGTKYTMQLDFYKNRLKAKGIDIMIPGITDIEFINNSIYEEFSKNIFLPATKEQYLRIMNEMIQEGAQGFVLGCTEIPILIKSNDIAVPLFDTAAIHAAAAVDFALS